MKAGFLLFRDMTQLDLTGPYEVLSRVRGMSTEIVAKNAQPVSTDKGLVLIPDLDFDSAPKYDIFVVPGGPGTDDAILDDATVDFVARQCTGATYVLGICTGSLLLGAAGVLRGKRAGGHWRARD